MQAQLVGIQSWHTALAPSRTPVSRHAVRSKSYSVVRTDAVFARDVMMILLINMSFGCVRTPRQLVLAGLGGGAAPPNREQLKKGRS